MSKIVNLSTKSTVTIVTVGLLSAGLYGCSHDHKDTKLSVCKDQPTCTQNTTKFEQYFNYSMAVSEDVGDKESKEVLERCPNAGGHWVRQFEDAQTHPTKMHQVELERVQEQVDAEGDRLWDKWQLNFVNFVEYGAVERYYERAHGHVKLEDGKWMLHNEVNKHSVEVTKDNWHKYQVVSQWDVHQCMRNGGLPSVDAKHNKTDVRCVTLPKYLRENFGADNIDAEPQCARANELATRLLYTFKSSATMPGCEKHAHVHHKQKLVAATKQAASQLEESSTNDPDTQQCLKARELENKIKDMKANTPEYKKAVNELNEVLSYVPKDVKLFDWQFGQCVLSKPCETIWEPIHSTDAMATTAVHHKYRYCKAKHEKKAEDKNVQCFDISRLDDACVVDAKSNSCGYYGTSTHLELAIGKGICQFTEACPQASANATKAGDKKKDGHKKAGDKKGDDKKGDDEKVGDHKADDKK